MLVARGVRHLVELPARGARWVHAADQAAVAMLNRRGPVHRATHGDLVCHMRPQGGTTVHAAGVVRRDVVHSMRVDEPPVAARSKASVLVVHARHAVDGGVSLHHDGLLAGRWHEEVGDGCLHLVELCECMYVCVCAHSLVL